MPTSQKAKIQKLEKRISALSDALSHLGDPSELKKLLIAHYPAAPEMDYAGQAYLRQRNRRIPARPHRHFDGVED